MRIISTIARLNTARRDTISWDITCLMIIMHSSKCVSTYLYIEYCKIQILDVILSTTYREITLLVFRRYIFAYIYFLICNKPPEPFSFVLYKIIYIFAVNQAVNYIIFCMGCFYIWISSRDGLLYYFFSLYIKQLSVYVLLHTWVI